MDDDIRTFELLPYEFSMAAPELVALMDGTTAIVCTGDILWGFEAAGGLVFVHNEKLTLH